jgi:hypothetical protein
MAKIMTKKDEYLKALADERSFRPFKTSYNLVSWEYDRDLNVINKKTILKEVGNVKVNNTVKSMGLVLHPSYQPTDLFPLWWNSPKIEKGEYVGKQIYYSIMFPIE